jgi:hypothetical protein
MPPPFIAGAVCAIDKDTADAKAGTFAIVTHVNNTQEGNLAGILFYPDLASAEQYAAHIVGGGGMTPATMPQEIMALTARGAAGAITDCTRRRATALTQPGNWGGFFAAHVPSAVNPDGTDLVGTTVQVVGLPVFDNGSIIAMFNGAIDIVSATSTNVDVKFNHAGVDRRLTFATSFIRSIVAPNATVPAPILLDRSLCGSLAFDLIRALPSSKTMPAGTLCGNEAMAACRAVFDAGLLATDPTQANFSLALTIDIRKVDDLINSGGGPPPGRVWPNLDAVRLGKEIKRACSTTAVLAPPQADQFPRVSALRSKCVSAAQFSSFLVDSVQVTIDKDGHRAIALNSEHVRSGALEKYLADRGQLGSVSNINNLDDQLDPTGMLEIIMFRMGDKCTAAAQGGSANMKVSFSNPDTTGTSDERARRLTVREDAERVLEDDQLRAQLSSLHDIASDPVALYSAVRSTSNIHLKRAITTNEDVDKALLGENTFP